MIRDSSNCAATSSGTGSAAKFMLMDSIPITKRWPQLMQVSKRSWTAMKLENFTEFVITPSGIAALKTVEHLGQVIFIRGFFPLLSLIRFLSFEVHPIA
jgi:hypothetical protein